MINPLEQFKQSERDHEQIRNRVTGSFGDLNYEPLHGGIFIKRGGEYPCETTQRLTLNVKELEWLHGQIGRLIGK